jgi:hypothetical protein
MRNVSFFFLLTFVCFAAFVSIAAQTPATAPKVLLIVREDIKTGKMAAHSVEANNTVQIWAKAKSPYHRLAMMPVAGNENEVTYLWPFDSYASLEKSIGELDKIATGPFKADFDRIQNRGEDYHSLQRDAIAVLREDLSYRSGGDMPKMRYMRVQTVRVRPGQVAAFVEARKIIKAAHEKANIDENMAVYQVVGGMQSGTFLIFIPWRSLDGIGTIPHGKDYFDAMGEDNQKKLDKLAEQATAFEETAIYAFNPQLSYLSPQFVAADPGFWTFKPMAFPGTVIATKKGPTRLARAQ